MNKAGHSNSLLIEIEIYLQRSIPEINDHREHKILFELKLIFIRLNVVFIQESE